MIVQIDSSGWSQERKNMTTSMVVSLLHKNGIVHTGVKVDLPNIHITSDAKDIDSVITKKAIEDEYDAWKIESDAETALAIQKYNTKSSEYESNVFISTAYEDIDAYIDGIQTLDELKSLVKDMAKAIRFKLIR